MEILKFAEPPKRSSRTSTQKRGGLMPLLAVVVSVAVVGGMSTTLAGTISLNTSGSVEFGQGVVTTAACDTSIRILPTSAFDTSTSTFSVSQIELRDIGISGGVDTATAGAGCLGKKLTFRAYNSSGVELDMNAALAKSIFITIPDSGTVTTAAAPNGSPNVAGDYSANAATVTITAASGFAGTTGTNGDSVAGKVTIGNLQIPGSVVKITLESSDA